MPEPENSEPIISEEELVKLTDLFRDFEGCGEPLSRACKEAKLAFSKRVSDLYFERIEPRQEFKEWTSSQFHSVIRNQCRERLHNSGPSFPCVPN
jgi:hypothetical protein